MITIKNSQRTVAINTQTLQQNAQIILDALKYSDFDLGIWLTTNQTIKRYNKQYRHKDMPTDILSFAYHPDLTPGKRIPVKSDEDKNLGDLIIAIPYVVQDAKRLGVTLDERLQVLLVHGICHLLGYDHELDADYKVMHRKELLLLKKLH